MAVTLTPALDIPTDFIDGVSLDFPKGQPVPADFYNRTSRGLETFSQAALAALGRGVFPWPDANSFKVSAGTGRNINVAQGSAVTYSGAEGCWAAMRTNGQLPNAVAGGLSASTTVYIHAQAKFSGDATDSRRVATTVILVSADAEVDGAEPLAKVTTGVSSVTSVIDLRPPERLASTDMFAIDRATTSGLVFGTLAGVSREDDGTLHLKAPATTTMAASTLNQFLQIENATAIITATNTTPDPTTHTALWLIDTDATSIIRAVKLFPAAGGAGSGSVTSVTGTAPIVSSGGATPAISLSDGGVTDAKIGNRTVDQTLATPGNTGPLLSLLSWLAGRIVAIMGTTHWYDAPGTTLAATATHIAAAAPHSGHTKADGSVAFTGDQSLGGHKITNAADGVAATDYATYGQMAAIAGGFIPSHGAKCAATGNVNISNPGTDTFDAVTLTKPGVDRIVLPNQTTTTQNGVYIWNGSAVAMTRATDFDSSGEVVPGVRVPIDAGVTYGDRALYIYSAGTLGTDPVLWQVDPGTLGEANTASNVGTGTGNVYQTKAGVNIVLRTLKALSSRLSIATNTNEVEFDVVEANLNLANMGGVATETQGGTHQSSYAVGDTLYASATNVLSKMAGNTNNDRRFDYSDGNGSVNTATGRALLRPQDYPVMGASGSSHAPGAVGDPGAVAGSTRFWREDGSWEIPGAATAPATVHLADAATIATDGSTGLVFFVSSAVDRTMGVPTNSVPGVAYNWFWKNTDVAAHTLTLITTGAGSFRYGQNVTVLPAVPAGGLLRFTAMLDPIDGKLGVSAYDIF